MKMFNWIKYTGQRLSDGQYLVKTHTNTLGLMDYSKRLGVWIGLIQADNIEEIVLAEKLK